MWSPGSSSIKYVEIQENWSIGTRFCFLYFFFSLQYNRWILKNFCCLQFFLFYFYVNIIGAVLWRFYFSKFCSWYIHVGHHTTVSSIGPRKPIIWLIESDWLAGDHISKVPGPTARNALQAVHPLTSIIFRAFPKTCSSWKVARLEAQGRFHTKK
jgi:hypothetical protein